MKKTLFFAAVAALFTFSSCHKEDELLKNGYQGEDLVFTATIAENGPIADNDTKTTVDAATAKVEWEIGDEITITDAASTSAIHAVTSINENGRATFTKVDGQPTLGAGPFTAIYGSDPATTQTYSTTAPSLPMSASSPTTSLMFTVSCGLLELNLSAVESISSIEVTGTPTNGYQTTYTLTCPSPVSIAGGAKFFIVLPDGEYTSFLINGQNGAICNKEKTWSSVTVMANHITPVSFKNLHFAVQLWADGPYWAKTNIGAETETDYGQYFAWGYSEGCVRNSANNGWVLASDGTTSKQFNTTDFPNRDAITYQDAAAANWGTGWSLPTDAQLKTLINADGSNKCSYSFVTSGTQGIRVTGKGDFANNSIFLPVAGSGENSALKLTESIYSWSFPTGYYRSTVPVGDKAATLNIAIITNNPYLKSMAAMTDQPKFPGLPVRPVLSTLTPSPAIPDAVLKGMFSVSSTKKVKFSRGNLQATCTVAGAPGTAEYSWGFAEHQYDRVGNSQGNTTIASQAVGDKVDMFGWSTSSTYYGINTSGSYSGDFVDWGGISTLPSLSGKEWQTLSKAEWNYLLYTRQVNGGTGEGKCFKKNVTVNGVIGLLVYPDNYTEQGSTSTSYTADQWTIMESKGCVFLPKSGYRDGSSVNNVNAHGYYWTSSPIDDNNAYRLNLADNNVLPENAGGRGLGNHVRLVCVIIPDGALNGVFSVSATEKVHFAKGNLRATCTVAGDPLTAKYSWSFAEHQYDFIGNANGNNSINAQVVGYIVDAFGWSSTATGKPFGLSTDTYSVNYMGTFVDWGKNAIVNGENKANFWRTLSMNEWTYIMNISNASSGARTDANRFAKARVNGVTGLIIFPDKYNNGVKINSVKGIAEVNAIAGAFPSESITDWTSMEKGGCVFLPASGYRGGSTVRDATTNGYYWSSTPNSNYAWGLFFNASDNGVLIADTGMRNGCSIRLVCPVK